MNKLLSFLKVIFLCVVLLLGIININRKSIQISNNKWLVFLDPGHGGRDGGTNWEGIIESEINSNIANFIYERIKSDGEMVFITRTSNYDLSSIYSKNHKLDDLKQRAQYINSSGATLLISIHVNSIKDTSVNGPMVYYRNQDLESKEIAMVFQEDLNGFANQNKAVHAENYYLFKKTKIPAILIECGFLSNPEERGLLNSSYYQKALAFTLYNSIKKIQRQ